MHVPHKCFSNSGFVPKSRTWQLTWLHEYYILILGSEVIGVFFTLMADWREYDRVVNVAIMGKEWPVQLENHGSTVVLYSSILC